MAPLDPRHVRVAQFAAPSADEKRHHFLHRFWPALPGWGGMAVFDRSWYGRVLVERVEGLATREQWLRAYDEINSFERTLADEGTILVKLWLQISAAGAAAALRRAAPPTRSKSWKLTAEDWENREKRAGVRAGGRGDGRPHRPAPCAPGAWSPAESKRYAGFEVVRTVNEEIEAGMRRWGQEPPAPIASSLQNRGPSFYDLVGSDFESRGALIP